MRLSKVLFMGLGLLLATRCAQAQAPAEKPGGLVAKNVDSGRRMFANAGCGACHGTQGQGTSLAPPIAPPPLEVGALIAYTRQPTGKMPAVPVATASDQDLTDIYAFLMSVAPPSSAAQELKGNAENGKKLFLAYGCYECHGLQGAGAAIAPRIGPPALSLAGVLRYVRAPTGQMPPYTAKVVSDQDLADIYSFLKTFPPPLPARSIPLLNP
ncbi:MAG TPA: cytochrome c [Candidatus Acidoferrum sp.]|nr:cytochrome c [Candidatus Acidoferrum sp.]